MSGVPEHTCYMTRGCVASINIGLPVDAVKGEQWNSCSTVLLDLFVEALTYSKDIIGLLVSGLGSVTDPYDDDDRERFDCLFEEAFLMAEEETDVSKHKGIQIFWARGKAPETVMIFKAHVKVTMVDSIILPNSWRRVEVARIEGATEHNEQVSMLIYNTHQPSFLLNPFEHHQKIELCKCVLRDAISEHSARENNVGCVVGGDADFMLSARDVAVQDEQSYRLHFHMPNYIFANYYSFQNPETVKNGNIGVVFGVRNLRGMQFDPRLALRSRGQINDVVLIGWYLQGQVYSEPQMSPVGNGPRFPGASEHSSASGTDGASDDVVDPSVIPVNPLKEKEPELAENSEADCGDVECEESSEEMQLAPQSFARKRKRVSSTL